MLGNIASRRLHGNVFVLIKVDAGVCCAEKLEFNALIARPGHCIVDFAAITAPLIIPFAAIRSIAIAIAAKLGVSRWLLPTIIDRRRFFKAFGSGLRWRCTFSALDALLKLTLLRWWTEVVAVVAACEGSRASAASSAIIVAIEVAAVLITAAVVVVVVEVIAAAIVVIAAAASTRAAVVVTITTTIIVKSTIIVSSKKEILRRDRKSDEIRNFAFTCGVSLFDRSKK